MPSLLLFADLDSQIFGALPFADAFASHGWKVVFNIPDREKIPAEVLNTVEERFPIVGESMDRLAFSSLTGAATAIGIFTTGSKIAQFRSDFGAVAALSDRRPFIFTGFNGVVYEKYEIGVFWRLGYDAVCLNGPRDELLFKAATMGSPFESQPYVVTGLKKPAVARIEKTEEDRKLMVFAEQVIVPATAYQRSWLFEKLAEWAMLNPDWDVVIKPRIRKSETTFHKAILHPQDARDGWPENMSISYDPLTTLLQSADLLTTISSTSVFDGIAAGVPVAVFGDFGINVNLGTHFFANSGVVAYLTRPAPFETLVDRRVDEGWLKSTGATDDYSPAALVEMAETWQIADLPKALPVQQMLALAPSAPPPSKAPAKAAAKPAPKAEVVPPPKPVGKAAAKALALPAPKPAAAAPPGNFGDAMAAANVAMAASQHGDAERLFKLAVSMNASSTNALRGLAEAQIANGNVEAARETLQKVRDMRPDLKSVASRLQSITPRGGMLSIFGRK